MQKPANCTPVFLNLSHTRNPLLSLIPCNPFQKIFQFVDPAQLIVTHLNSKTLYYINIKIYYKIISLAVKMIKLQFGGKETLCCTE
jgi:hypothetical protein